VEKIQLLPARRTEGAVAVKSRELAGNSRGMAVKLRGLARNPRGLARNPRGSGAELVGHGGDSRGTGAVNAEAYEKVTGWRILTSSLTADYAWL
jgi:hypothetical protein